VLVNVKRYLKSLKITNICPSSKRAAQATAELKIDLATGSLVIDNLYVESGTLMIIQGSLEVTGILQLTPEAVLSVNTNSGSNVNFQVQGCLNYNGAAVQVISDNPSSSASLVTSSCSTGAPSKVTAVSTTSVTTPTNPGPCYTVHGYTFVNGVMTLNTTSAPCPIPPSAPTPPPPSDSNVGAIVGAIVGVLVVVFIVVLLFVVPKTRAKITGLCGGEEEKDARQTRPGTPAGRDTLRPDRVIPTPPFKVEAIADYAAVDTTQMSITKGSKYEVTRVDEGHHWFQSRMPNGRLAWFPASYARIEGESY